MPQFNFNSQQNSINFIQHFLPSLSHHQHIKVGMTVNKIYQFELIYIRPIMFGGTSQSISGQLFSKLKQPNLTPQELFSIPNINGDLRQNIQTFLAFSARNRNFTLQMFNLCFNSTYQQLNNENKKKVAQYTIQALSNDEDALSDFLFNSVHTMQNTSEISEKIQGESQENIESEARRLFSDQVESIQNDEWEKQPQVFEKFELVKLSLVHLSSQQINETCLGYIHKVYSSILRRQGKCVLEFFQENEQYLDNFFNNLQYPSISGLIALMLSSEDRSGKYQFEKLKASIFQKLVDYALKHIGDPEKYEGFMMTVEEILNSTKQSYYEYFEDFKRCANILVSEETLRKFHSQLQQQDQIVFGNAIQYLELILRRITNQDDDNDYYRQHENSEPTMKFQHQFLFQETEILADLFEKSASYSSIIRVNFLCFLLNLLKLQKNDEGYTKAILFKKILKFYLKEPKSGMVKNYLYQILDLLIKKESSQEIQEISTWLISENVIDPEISSRITQTTNNANKDLVSCFFLSILFQIENKKKGFLEKSGSKFSLALQDLNEIYRTKLADQVQDTFFEMDFIIPKKFTENEKSQEKAPEKETEKQMHVGRNNILIPSLNLPHRNQSPENTKVLIEEQAVQQFSFSGQPTRQSIIQDLKNTIIKLPEKMKTAKKQSLQKNEQKQKKREEILSKSMPIETNMKNGVERVQGFYVRHLILF